LNICQLRLDFTDVEISATATTGICVDSLEATGPAGRNHFALCGTLTGQHIYVENARSTAAMTVKVTIGTGGGGKWNIKATQVECSSLSRGIPDCNQYMTGVTGTFKSYNQAGGTMLQNTDFNTCIRREAGYCAIQFATSMPAAGTPDNFQLDTAVANAGKGGATGARSYIHIHGAFNHRVYTGDALVNSFLATATNTGEGTVSVAGPALYRVIHITLGATTAGDDGFSLDYTQIPCGVDILGPTSVIP